MRLIKELFTYLYMDKEIEGKETLWSEKISIFPCQL